MLYELARPLLFHLPPETAHDLACRALAVWQGALQQRPRPAAVHDPLLAQELWGLSFPNPLGLAAGFDKNGALPHVWPRSASASPSSARSPRWRSPATRRPASSACRPSTR